MKESVYILNVPEAVSKRMQEIEIPEEHKALKALDESREVVLMEDNLYLATDYAIAIGNTWSETRKEDAAFFMATDWHRYAKSDTSPTDYHESFTEFLRKPDLLIVSGLSFMKTKAAREQMDDVLHQRVSRGKRNIIAGWNKPAAEFSFNADQELAGDTRSEFPLLHQRTSLSDMAEMVSVPHE